MSIYLHIIIVSENPEKGIAFEFDAGLVQTAIAPFEIEKIVWGTERDFDAPSLVEILMRRGWQLTDIGAALARARQWAMKETLSKSAASFL